MFILSFKREVKVESFVRILRSHILFCTSPNRHPRERGNIFETLLFLLFCPIPPQTKCRNDMVAMERDPATGESMRGVPDLDLDRDLEELEDSGRRAE